MGPRTRRDEKELETNILNNHGQQRQVVVHCGRESDWVGTSRQFELLTGYIKESRTEAWNREGVKMGRNAFRKAELLGKADERSTQRLEE